ncbi:klaroid protein-like isoform X2 [Vespa velutina]|uniref:klaroid protein-like isoform X2 n=1 Tax=Vespa velutina TaxID=202808 RepID=UPI001FB49F15|nr:klaroid protein-like isoform X2 [Vespa velutina]
MESEQHHYELRSRSRSRSHTPLVPNRVLLDTEQAEHHYDLRSKSRERSHTPAEATSSRRSGSRSMPSSASKTRDQNMQAIIENVQEPVSEIIVSESQSKQSDSSVSVASKKVERRSERQRAKRQIFVNGQDDTKEETNYNVPEQVRKSLTPHRVLTSDYSSEEGEREDLPSRPGSAYEIYKQAGEWWNKFPKTDYTYSQKSQCRYEIAPGILAMPNMSRRSIHSDGSNNIGNTISTNQESLRQSSLTTSESGLGDTLDSSGLKDTIDQNLIPIGDLSASSHTSVSNFATRSTMFKKTHIEQYTMHREIIYTKPVDSLNVRQRYPLWGKTSIDYDDTHKYDSDTELNEIMPSTSIENTQRWKVTQQFLRFNTIIVAWFLKSLEFLKLRTSRKREYYTHHERIRYNGYWSMPYVQSFLSILEVQTASNNEINTILENVQRLKQKSAQNDEYSTRDYNLNVIINRLNNRITELEEKDSYQTEYLINISQMLQNPKENEIDVWQKVNGKIMDIEDRLNNLKTDTSNVVVELQTLRELYSQLKVCCDTNKQFLVPETLRKEIDNILGEYFGSTVSKKDLSLIIEKLKKLSMNEDVSTGANYVIKEDGALNERILKIINDRLKIYDADKTGRVDYALETAGGEIISTRCTQTYGVKSRVLKLLGLTIYSENNNPRTVIQRNPIQPGACWPFQGFPGYLLIKLRNFIYVTGFTIEHVAKTILPSEKMESAPRKFNVWGLIDQNDPEPVMFGDYEFTDSDENLQYFSVQNTQIVKPYEYVELRIHSNHGELEYTCLYRFRVHGKPA